MRLTFQSAGENKRASRTRSDVTRFPFPGRESRARRHIVRSRRRARDGCQPVPDWAAQSAALGARTFPESGFTPHPSANESIHVPL